MLSAVILKSANHSVHEIVVDFLPFCFGQLSLPIELLTVGLFAVLSTQIRVTQNTNDDFLSGLVWV